ncbi:MAG: hypothetical protein IJ217_03135 [Clostridia bacterium]|nr:hypothetical protein [Clostridia bacterium]
MDYKVERHDRTARIIGTFVLVSFILPIGYLIYRIVVSPAELPEEATIRTKPDYVLMLVQCILGIFALMMPSFVSKRYKVQIPTLMYILYVVFLYGAIFLGEVRSFYYNVPHWDTILHTFSGAMIGALGFSFVSLLNREENVHLKLTPFFIAFFAFCFAVTLGVVWEIYEYTFDGVLGLNMQKFALEDGTLLSGRLALADTMKDLIVDAVGAFVMSLIGYISLKNNKGWVEKMLIKKE